MVIWDVIGTRMGNAIKILAILSELLVLEGLSSISADRCVLFVIVFCRLARR